MKRVVIIVSVFVFISCNNNCKEENIIFKQFYFSKLDTLISLDKLFDTDEAFPLIREKSAIFYANTEYFRLLTNRKFCYIEVEHHPIYQSQSALKADIKYLKKWYKKNKCGMTKEKADSIVKVKYEQETGNQAILKYPSLLSIQANEIVILPYDFTVWQNENYTQAELEYNDFELSNSILTICVTNYNIEQEKRFQEICSRYPDTKFDKNHFVIDLTRYYRQYICVTNERGEKEVWINFHCAEFFFNSLDNIDETIELLSAWKAGKLVVLDGGNCFFNLKINLTTKKYYDLSVNGEA